MINVYHREKILSFLQGKSKKKGGEKMKFRNIFKKYGRSVLIVGAGVASFAGSAFATSNSGFDYSTVADAVVSEITTGLPLFAGMVGLVIGIPLVVHLAKRLAR